MSTLFIIITWLIVIAVKVAVDSYQIEVLKNNIRHGFEILLVAIMALFHQALSGVNRIEEWEFAGTILIFQVCSYYLLFDLGLNIMRGKEIFYVGKTSAIDRIMRHNTPLLLGAKLFCLVGVVWSVIELFKY